MEIIVSHLRHVGEPGEHEFATVISRRPDRAIIGKAASPVAELVGRCPMPILPATAQVRSQPNRGQTHADLTSPLPVDDQLGRRRGP